MYKYLTVVALLCISLVCSAQKPTVKNGNNGELALSYSTTNLSARQITYLGTPFSILDMEGYTHSGDYGEPSLPSLTNIIEIPLGNGLGYEIVEMVCDTIDGNGIGITSAIMPVQPPRSKSNNEPLRLVMNHDRYNTDEFCGQPTIVLEEIGVARDRNLATITFNPVRWNPVTNKFIIVKSLTVTIYKSQTDIAATQRMKRLHSSRLFSSDNSVINTVDNKPIANNAPIRYTIVAHSMFRGALDEFATWKRRKGFLVDLVYTDDPEVGSTLTSISNYLKGLYNNATADSPAPTYVLLVGDVAQIPAFQMSSYGGSLHHSDLKYCTWSEGDDIPDCYIGRFSAQNLEQLTPQISKTLMYEQYTFPNDSYLAKAALIAGVDGGNRGDFGYTHADPAMDYTAKYYINRAQGFSTVAYYKNLTTYAPNGVSVTGSSQSSSTSGTLKSYYNNGCGWVNYSAHGSETAWGSPSFTAYDATQMSNNNKPMVMIGNCCLSNSFETSECLGEALLRKSDNAGAVAYIGASDNTYWVEDFYWAVGIRNNINGTMNASYNSDAMGMYDHLFHTHGEQFSDWYTTMGSMIYAGNMEVQSSGSDPNMKRYYWEIYHLMGDPSLMPYIHGKASTMTPSVQATVANITSSLHISCPQYAYIAMTDSLHNLVAATFADGNGNATLHFESALELGRYEIVITAQGYKPYTKTVLVEAQGPFVKTTSMTPRSDLIAGERISFDITLKNIGIDEADSLTLEFYEANNVMLVDTIGRTTLNTYIAAGETITIGNRCNATVWNTAADGSTAKMRVTARWGGRQAYRSASTFEFTVAAPNISVTVDSLGNNMEQDSSALLTLTIANHGHADLHNMTAQLLSLEPDLLVTRLDTNQPNDILQSQTISTQYIIRATINPPTNRRIPFLHITSSDNYSTVDTIYVTFGRELEVINFDDNQWGDYNWFHGENPWELTTSRHLSGDYSARSKSWVSPNGNGKSSQLTIVWTSTVDDSISFFKSVSSEEGYDFLRFYIDGELKEQSSGEKEWSRSSYEVSAGTHTFLWSYEKDLSSARGNDCAWIDDIHMPPLGEIYLHMLDTVCKGDILQLIDTTINTELLTDDLFQTTRKSGNAIYNYTIYVVPAPSATITGGEITIDEGEVLRLTASGGSKYLWNNGLTNPIIDVCPTTTTTYSVTVSNGGCSQTASTTVTVIPKVGIEQPNLLKSDATIHIYPNPAYDIINIESAGIDEITIADITGRKLMEIQSNPQNDRQTTNISHLPSGIYIIICNGHNHQRVINKLIKK